MSDSQIIEQIKQELKEHLEATNPSMAGVMMGSFVGHPSAGDAAFWVNIRKSLVPAASGTGSNDGPKFVCKEDGGSVIITEFDINYDLADPKAWYKRGNKSVVIPNEIDGKPVKGIGDGAFYAKCLTGLTLPDGLEFIGADAFKAGGEFTELKIPDSVTSIGKEAFDGGKLVNVTLGKGLQTLSEGVFRYNQISSIDLSSVVTIEDKAFENNNFEGMLTIPKNIKSIGREAFAYNKLTLVVVPDDCNVGREIGGVRVKVSKESDYAFETQNTHFAQPEDFTWKKTADGKGVIIEKYAGKAAEVFIPSQIEGLPVTELANKSFAKIKTRLTVPRVIIPDSVITIGNEVFSGCELTSVEIGKGVQTIGGSAFRGNKIKEAAIPDSVITIGSSAFCECELTSVRIGKGVQTIKSDAFKDNKLKEVTIPDSVKSIETRAFCGNQLKSVSVPKNASLAISNSGSFKNPIDTITSFDEGVNVTKR